MKPNENFLAQMREATQLLQTSGPAAATAAIQRALGGIPASHAGAADDSWSAPMPRPEVFIDINRAPAGVMDAAPDTAADILTRMRNPSRWNWKGSSARQPVEDVEAAPEIKDKGKFLNASCTNHAGTRGYKVYVPSGYSGQALPVIVMLHGCKQNPDDFAAGTGMNSIAEQNNCFVVYPAQTHAANGSNCWNWFNAGDQQRNQGEPSIIADITREVIRTYNIDPSRVYVAGLSAGGAMAAIMGATYPELYAAVGIHSGLPYGAAHDLPSAFAAMKNGMAKPNSSGAFGKPVPAIVFHGDRDTTVHSCNGDQVLAQCTGNSAASPADRQSKPCVTVEKGSVPQGRSYTKTVQFDGDGKAFAEHWTVHGAGHAWSGGTRNGSYTDPKGPNAAQEMLRFFYTHSKG
jgi:poly(hydroxyalkanoate) depolymerase family esterase